MTATTAAPGSRGPASAAGRTPPDPYRPLFAMGALLALAGALPWLFTALGLQAYPGSLHATLMIQGFELSFVGGFLLTALPRFTRAEPCRPWELAAACAAMAGFGACALAGLAAPAQALSLAFVLVVAAAALRRFLSRRNDPPEEFVFVGLGLGLGIAGCALGLAAALGLPAEPTPRFAVRVLALGMVLSLVLGLGALLVPVFAGIRDPLVIPRVAGPHERTGRRILYGALGALLVLALAAEAAAGQDAGAWIRLLPVTAMGLWVWKLHRRPRRPGLTPLALWGAGWSVLAGSWLAALAPGQRVASTHVVLIGGFALLTAAIGTRVLVTHGGHSPERERDVLTPVVVAGLLGALVLRLAADAIPGGARPHLAASAVSWSAGWALWLGRALPHLARR